MQSEPNNIQSVHTIDLNLQKKRWQLAPKAPDSFFDPLSHINPILAQVLFNRGHQDADAVNRFLSETYLLNDDPFLLPDMQKAVDRILKALEADEIVVVYGDFDADGVTSTVLMTEALRGLGFERETAIPYIPDRIDEGYGLNNDSLSKIKEKFDADLLITVDCGIRSVTEVEHANEIGMDVIITDHHSVGAEIPPAHAVINPKRADSKYPDDMLAGVGIAYKIAQALHTASEAEPYDLNRFLDLVAIGTVADLAPLQKENRHLVIRGLAELTKAERPGVAALAQIARLQPERIKAESIGFILGPRINAAGRLDKATLAARLLAAKELSQAQPLAMRLDALNGQRRKKTDEYGDLAVSMMKDPEAAILIAASEEFESGIVGLVASRLCDRHYRPSIVIELGEKTSRGSCRSIEEFHITDALDEVGHLLVRHGGHAQAAGFTIENQHIDAFSTAMLAIAEQSLDLENLKPSLAIDVDLPLEEIDWALLENLQSLEPTGIANETPVFMSRDVQVLNNKATKDGKHLQMEVTDGVHGYKCIGFGLGEWAGLLPLRVDVAYQLSINEWRGRRTIQLMVRDIRPASLE